MFNVEMNKFICLICLREARGFKMNCWYSIRQSATVVQISNEKQLKETAGEQAFLAFVWHEKTVVSLTTCAYTKQGNSLRTLLDIVEWNNHSRVFVNQGVTV